MKAPNQFLVFNVGCIECGVSSDVVGTYDTFEKAERIANLLDKSLSWRQGGQNSFEVFDLSARQNTEYAEAIAKAGGAS